MHLRNGFCATKRLVILIILVLAPFLFISGCTGQNDNAITDADNADQQQASQFPLTITDFANRSVTFKKSPKRIVTVNPADMEIIYALGGKVVGRPQKSFGDVRPPEAEKAEAVGRPQVINFEKVSALKADMFVGHKRLNVKDVPTLEALGLNVVLTQGDSVDEVIDLIGMYGNILNKQEQANALVNTIEQEIEKTVKGNQRRDVKALILFGIPNETMAALPQSLAGNLFELAGVENICKGMPGLKTYPTYAQLSLERILEADPDVIYFMSMGDDAKPFERFQAEMANVPAWNKLTAIKNDRLINLPYELFGTNPGPRIVESLQFLQNSLNSLGY